MFYFLKPQTDSTNSVAVYLLLLPIPQNNNTIVCNLLYGNNFVSSAVQR